jgi:hypothetical protein
MHKKTPAKPIDSKGNGLLKHSGLPGLPGGTGTPRYASGPAKSATKKAK